MSKFVVNIIETLEKQVVVEAEDKYEALKTIRKSYSNEEIVLNAKDLTATDFIVYEGDQIVL